MYNGNYEVASLVYIYTCMNIYVCSKTIFSPVLSISIYLFTGSVY